MMSTADLYRRGSTARGEPENEAAQHEIALRLKAVVLLAGAVRTNRFSRSIGRFTLALPIDDRRNLLDWWAVRTEELGQWLGLDQLPLRVLVNDRALRLGVPDIPDGTAVSVEEDKQELRGTGGVLTDVAAEYEDSDLLLVANGAQLITDSLIQLVTELVQTQGAVSLKCSRDGLPSSLMLVRCGALRCIPDMGFVDLKEQALARIAERHRVMVVERDRTAGMPIRTLSDYIAALRRHHEGTSLGTPGSGPLDEAWKATFSIVEEGAEAADDARIHNSVVLRGASVDRGAVVVNSVISEGSRVKAGRSVINVVFGRMGEKKAGQKKS
jgi:hypothetical protein